MPPLSLSINPKIYFAAKRLYNKCWGKQAEPTKKK